MRIKILQWCIFYYSRLPKCRGLNLLHKIKCLNLAEVFFCGVKVCTRKLVKTIDFIIRSRIYVKDKLMCYTNYILFIIDICTELNPQRQPCSTRWIHLIPQSRLCVHEGRSTVQTFVQPQKDEMWNLYGETSRMVSTLLPINIP